MIKAHRHAPQTMMRRTSRVYLNDLNAGKAETLKQFLHLCHDALQYFVDLFWQRHDVSATLADRETVHRGRDRFGLTTRLAQALAKQAKEMVRSAHAQGKGKPRVRKHTVTLYRHFVKIEPCDGWFDWAVKLIGSGAPRLVIPVPSTSHLHKFLADGWHLSKTIRLGRDHRGRLFIDFIFEKPPPPLKTEGAVVGMDNNYRSGLVFSDGQWVAQRWYALIQSFGPREKHTRPQIKSLIGRELKKLVMG